MAMTFEDQVLGFIKKQGFAGSNAGIGRLSAVSKRSGNEDIARAISQLSRAKPATDSLNSVGKNVLKNIEEIASKALDADSVSQSAMMKQIKATQQLLPLIEENNDQQKAGKAELVRFIRSTERGMKKNSRLGNRFTELLRGALPSLSGIASTLSSKITMFSGNSQNSPGKQSPNLQAGAAESSQFNAEVIEGMGDALEDAMNGSTGPVLKQILGTNHDTLTGVEKIEKLIRATAPSEEAEREDFTFRQSQLELLADIARNSNQSLRKKEEPKSTGGGLGSWLLNFFLAKTGLSAFMKSLSLFRGPLNKMMSVFRGVGRLIMRLPGAGLLSKAFSGIARAGGMIGGMVKSLGGLAMKSGRLLFKGLGKLISFPVTFVIAASKGIYDAVDAFMNGASLSEAAIKGLEGFADFFLFGFLEKIQGLVGDKLDVVFDLFKGDDKKNQALGPGLLMNKPSRTVVKGNAGIIGQSPENMEKITGLKIKGEMKQAFNVLPSLISKVNGHAGKIGERLDKLAKNPNGFLATKLKSVNNSIKDFFLGMIPDWIPSWAFPSSIAQDLKRARGGVDAPNIFDSTASMSYPNLDVGAFRATGTAGPIATPKATPKLPTPTDKVPAPTRTTPPTQTKTNAPKVSTGSSESKTDDQVVDDIIRREGGYNPKDPGGGSMYGVTGLTLAASRGVPSVTAEEVQALSQDEARAIYKKEYISPFDDIKDQNLRELVIDSGVNTGPSRARRWLNESQGKGLQGQELYDDVLNTRQKFYNDLAERDPAMAPNLPGWTKRVDEFRGKQSGAPTMDTESPVTEGRAEAMRTVDSQATANLNAATASAGAARVASISAPSVNSNSTVNNSTSVNNKRRPVNEEPSVVRFMTPVLA